jgi:hypothetical protein
MQIAVDAVLMAPGSVNVWSTGVSGEEKVLMEPVG